MSSVNGLEHMEWQDMQSQEYNKSQNTYYEGEKFSAWQIMDWFTDDYVGVNAFNICNVIKYLIRYDQKGTPKQDLEKALNYINNVSTNITNNTNNNELFEVIIQDFIRTKNNEEEFYFKSALRFFLKGIWLGKEESILTAKTFIEHLKDLY